MRTSRARYASLIAGCFVLFSVLFASPPAAALRPDEVFIVAPVPVDVTAESALAARGHTVRHGFSATNLTPQGELARQPGDPATFEP